MKIKGTSTGADLLMAVDKAISEETCVLCNRYLCADPDCEADCCQPSLNNGICSHTDCCQMSGGGLPA